jgi:hypothetical protein
MNTNVSNSENGDNRAGADLPREVVKLLQDRPAGEVLRVLHLVMQEYHERGVVDQLEQAQTRIARLEARVAELTRIVDEADLALDAFTEALAEAPALRISPN